MKQELIELFAEFEHWVVSNAPQQSVFSDSDFTLGQFVAWLRDVYPLRVPEDWKGDV